MLTPLTTPHWLVFDLDETLAPTQRHGFPVLMATLQAAMKSVDTALPESLDDFWAHTRETFPDTGNIVKAVAAAYGLDETWVEAIHQQASLPSASAVTGNLVANAAIVAALTKLKEQGHHLHVLTLSHAEYAHPVLHHLGLHALFTPHIHTGAFKRVPAPYQTLLNDFPLLANLPRMMVEDSPGNLVPAKQLGFITIGIGPRTMGQPAVDHAFPTLSDFLAALGV